MISYSHSHSNNKNIQQKILKGVNTLADNVASTLGPRGRNVILHHKESGHKHLVAGNTRLTHGVQDRKEKVPVHTIEY